MGNDVLIGYIGDRDFHDGSIMTVERKDDIARIVVRGASGNGFVVEFKGVRDLKARHPEGMVLYALAEMRSKAPMRRFVFVNWDEKDDAILEIDAESYSIACQEDE